MGILKGNNEGKFFKVNSPLYYGFGLKDGYMWFDSTNNLRINSTKPSDLDSDGTVVAAISGGGALSDLSNLASVQINTDLLPAADATDTVGDATHQWLSVYSNYVYLNSTAILDGSSAGVITITGSVKIGVAGTGYDTYFYGDTSGLHLWWDQNGATNGALIFNGATATPTLQFVNSNVTYSLALSSDVATLSATDHANAKLILGTTGTNGMDVTIQTATSGAGIVVEASADKVTFDDLTVAFMKTATAVAAFTVAANTLNLDAGTDNDTFNIGATTGLDLRLHGHTAGYDVLWDHSQDTMVFLDSAILGFGNTGVAPDFTLKFDGTDLLMEAGTADIVWKLGATTNFNVQIYAATATNYILFDTDDTKSAVTFHGISAIFDDSTYLAFGTGASTNGDIKFTYTGGTNVLGITQVAAGTGSITVGADGKGIDWTFYSETASSFIKFDQTTDTMQVAASYICMGDASGLRFGTGTTYGGDLQMAYVGATNILAVTQIAAGTGSITFGVDGKGIDMTWYVETASSYVKLDQANDRLLVYAGALDFGNGTTEYHWHFATNSLVLDETQDNAAGKLILGETGTNGLDITIVGAGAGQTWTWDAALGTLTAGAAAYLNFPTNEANGRGLCLPVKTTAGAPGTTGTETGCVVFNTNDNKFYVKVAAGWVASAALA